MSKLETNTIDTVSGTTNLTIGSTNTSTITMPNGALSGQNYPAFEATISANFSLTDLTAVKVQFDTENFDTDNCYDNSTNYRFTPTVAGKYFVYTDLSMDTQQTASLKQGSVYIYKNGSAVKESETNFNDNFARRFNNKLTVVIDMNGSSDYLEVYCNLDNGVNNSNVQLNYRSGLSNYFGAYRIGA